MGIGGGGGGRSRSPRSPPSSRSRSPRYSRRSSPGYSDDDGDGVYHDCDCKCSKNGYIILILFGAALFAGLLSYLIVVLLSAPPILCTTASEDLFDGEQNLCKVPDDKNTVHVIVERKMKNKFSSYWFDKQPQVLDEVRRVRYRDNKVVLYAGYYRYFALALPKGSVVNVSLDTDDTRYTVWYFSKFYKSMSDLRSNYIWSCQGTCSGSFVVEKSSTYYVTGYQGYNFDDDNAYTEWDISVDYKKYNVSNAKKTCIGKTDCKFTGTKGGYVVSVLEPGSLEDIEFTKNNIFSERNYMKVLGSIIILVVFLVISLLFVGGGSFGYCSLTSKEKAASESTAKLLETDDTASDCPVETPVATPADEPEYDAPCPTSDDAVETL